MFQKLEDRSRIFKLLDLPEERKEKLKKLLQPQYMSSEDTEDENTLAVRPLPWISQKAEKLKFTLDNEKAKRMSSQSKRQAKKKVKGRESTRPKPSRGSAWIYKTPTGAGSSSQTQ